MAQSMEKLFNAARLTVSPCSENDAQFFVLLQADRQTTAKLF